jgi:large subunit ribosomal protein L25
MPEVLTVETGRPTGSRASNRVRHEGKVPGVLYGLGMEPTALAVSWPELRRALVAGGLSSPIRIRMDGREHLTIVREIQRHPVRRDVTHIDFLAVDPDQPVSIEVPVTIIGLEEGDDAGDLAHTIHAITVSAKPAAIPSELGVDAAKVRELGSFRVADLQLPDGVTTDVDPETVLVATGADVEIIDQTLEPTAEEAEGEEAAADQEAAADESEAAAEGEPAAEGGEK